MGFSIIHAVNIHAVCFQVVFYLYFLKVRGNGILYLPAHRLDPRYIPGSDKNQLVSVRCSSQKMYFSSSSKRTSASIMVFSCVF